MRTFHLSPLGFLMKSLRIQTVTLARSLHVDASLVSKWKSGDRRLTERSVCFDDVVSFILNYAQQSPQQFYDTLSKAMPMEDITNKSNLKTVLRKMLATPNWQIKNQAIDSLNSDIPKTTISLFDGADGMRRAVSSLLKFAEKLPYAGEIIFIDTSDYRWLVTDESYTANFTNRLIKLLARGFRIRFVIHYSANHEHSIQLFTAVSPLIFHRNVDWYYYEYYDDTLFDSSLFILKHTISLLNITSERIPASTMAFTDISLVMRHESLAEHIIGQCRPIFENFLSQDFWQILKNVCQLRRRGAFYAYLPSPAFIFAQENILSAILDDNHLSESDKMDCITLNKSGFQSMLQKKEPFIYILQLEEMERRIHNQPFISTSLSLLSKHTIKIQPYHYARELRILAQNLIHYDNFRIVFVSEADNIKLPDINCWCKQYTWIIQMDQQGFRLSDEPSIVSAASIALERCIRLIPPERKDKKTVQKYLLHLADELERMTF